MSSSCIPPLSGGIHLNSLSGFPGPAQSASAQIGRNYSDLKEETEKFIHANFPTCTTSDLQRLCDEIVVGRGIYLGIREFEERYFAIADRVKAGIPIYAHLSISHFGLQFEYPEHHFVQDIQSAVKDLSETQVRIQALPAQTNASAARRREVANLVGREKFLCRTVISSAFSLVEAFLSGLFFTATETGQIGHFVCDGAFIDYARKKESAAMKDRIDRVVTALSSGRYSAKDEPYSSFLGVCKSYRDAIHHTTPFERKAQSLAAGARLLKLYEINLRIALQCLASATETVLMINDLAYGGHVQLRINQSCEDIKKELRTLSGQR